MPRPIRESRGLSRRPMTVTEMDVFHQQVLQLAFVNPLFVRALAYLADHLFNKYLAAGQVVAITPTKPGRRGGRP